MAETPSSDLFWDDSLLLEEEKEVLMEGADAGDLFEDFFADDNDDLLLSARTQLLHRVTADLNYLTGPADERTAAKHELAFARRDARSRAVYSRILAVIKRNLEENQSSTLRDLFYEDVALFRTQDAVVRVLNLLAHKWQILRDDATIVAAPRSLVAGPLDLVCERGTLDADSNWQTGTLIPPPSALRELRLHELRVVRRVVVIEKQATFDRVMQLRGSSAAEPMQRCLDTTVWITSRGFADHACAFLVHQLHCLFGGLRMYALCDNDPDGYFIYHTIKQGAVAMRGRRESKQSAAAAAGALGAGGLQVVDWLDPAALARQEARLTLYLSERDHFEGCRLLHTKFMDKRTEEPVARKNLQWLLFTHTKLEMQALGAANENGGLGRLLLGLQ